MAHSGPRLRRTTLELLPRMSHDLVGDIADLRT